MIKFVKLITNDDLIADVEENSKKDKQGEYVPGFYLKNAVRIVFTPQGVGMVPYSPFTLDSQAIFISENNVLYTSELEEEIKNAYNSKFGSGIIVASNAANFNVIT